MGTRSYIARQIGDDQYLTIYCQLNGYPEDTGATLVKHYDTSEKVNALLALGDLYYLREKLSPALNLLVCSSLEFGTTSKRDRIAFDSRAFVRMMAVDVHVPKGLFWRQMLLSVWTDPISLSMNAIQAAPAHRVLLIEPMIAPITIPTTQPTL